MKRIKTQKITKTRHDCWPHRKEEGHNLGRASRFYIYTRRLQKLSFLSYTNQGRIQDFFKEGVHPSLALLQHQ